MQSPPEKKKPRGWCPEAKSKESSLTNNDATILPLSNKEVKEKRRSAPTLMGWLFGNVLIIPCGLCGEVHRHWWGINTSQRKDLRYAHCIDPEVEQYDVAKAPRAEMAWVNRELKGKSVLFGLERLVPGSKAYAEEKALKDEWRAWRDAMKRGNGRAS
jgi:hypothetical protein